MVSPMVRSFAAWSLVFALPVVLPAQKEHVLGTQGAKVSLPAAWRAGEVVAGYGDWQFHVHGARGFFGGTKPVSVAVTEYLGVLTNEADYRRVFAERDRLAQDTPLTVAQEADWLRVSRAGDDPDGDWSYRSELLVLDGYALHLLAWAEPADKKVLAAKVEEFLDGVLIPGADSSWCRGIVPVTETYTRGAVQVSYALRPFVLRRAAEDNYLRAYETGDGQQYFYLDHGERETTADRVVDAEVRTFVGECLARGQSWAELAAFLQPFAAAADAHADDLVAWSLARMQGPARDSADPAVLGELHAAVVKQPREARLYWLLGQQHERTGPAGKAAARACYERVLELQEYGAVAGAAREALRELDR